jgi:carboxyl-terminal processing protease
VPEGKVLLQERHDNVVTNTYHATNNNILKGVPTAVLINAGSASAAEITAGALHDNGVATLYGEKSFGKGVVQEVRDLPAGAELKVTIASWYRPNGQNINKKGITPDHVVTMTDADYQQGKDPQKDAALAFILQK